MERRASKVAATGRAGDGVLNVEPNDWQRLYEQIVREDERRSDPGETVQEIAMRLKPHRSPQWVREKYVPRLLASGDLIQGERVIMRASGRRLTVPVYRVVQCKRAASKSGGGGKARRGR